MPRYRHALPQLDGTTFIADGGLETCLMFMEGLDLPCFASFPLVADKAGQGQLERSFKRYLQTADERGLGFVLDTPTWRANADWGAKLGYSAAALAEINRQAVAWAVRLRDTLATQRTPVVVNGLIGPRGDGYRADARMDAAEAERYHRAQVEAFEDTEADMVSALTLPYAEEAIGIARGPSLPHARRDFLHRRDRRQAALGRNAAAGD